MPYTQSWDELEHHINTKEKSLEDLVKNNNDRKH